MPRFPAAGVSIGEQKQIALAQRNAPSNAAELRRLILNILVLGAPAGATAVYSVVV
jgi:hypothetical protein